MEGESRNQGNNCGWNRQRDESEVVPFGETVVGQAVKTAREALNLTSPQEPRKRDP